MAEGDITFTNHFKEQLLLKAIDMDSDTFKVVLLNGYSITPDGNLGYADLTGEISASGYTAGGATLGSLAVAQDDANNRASWDAADVTWTSLATATITAAAIYDDTVTTPVADPIVCFIEIATNSNGGNYTLQWNANGIGLLS